VPRVSVVVAARDAADTLPATLESIRAQTFTDHETIVVDDGSADATGEVARSFSGVRVLRNDPARRQAAARNRGAREAAGELIATLDADDTWHPAYLERQLAAYGSAVAAGRRVGAVCCDARLIAPDGSPAGTWTGRVGRPGRIDVTALLRENQVFTSVLCPREVFLALGGYDEDPRLGVEDYDLWVRMAERGYEIVFNDEVLADYRLSLGLSSQVERMAAGSRLLMERALERGNLTPAQRRIARRRRRVFGVVAHRARISAEPHPARKALRIAHAAPLIAASALEHPERWRKWLREGVRPAGARRHTGT
jgi:glycosyltransferase involved in cell wall biosynthesis